VLEALLLWHVTGVRRDMRQEQRMALLEQNGDITGSSQGMYTFGVFVRFIATMFLWPFAAAYRTGFFKKAPQLALWTCIIFSLVFAIGALPIYGVVGFFWACAELGAWIARESDYEQ
jgi:hypothetical protein